VVELNVVRQVMNVASTTIVQAAWHRGQELAVHGWVYSLSDGLLKDLGCTISDESGVESDFRIDQWD
jgi:carbonic anhydrase